ncbi:ABC transporter permease [Spiroplasma endosymbiont of Panorpa germanica]|uniref:ABC transporter permease n=1 Tax=Spiroplasma endosymbiont of Panorpa germanica TaxID=3066314 RepID=UPI0030CDD1CE
MTTNLEKSEFGLKRSLNVFKNLFLLISKSFFRNARGPLFMFIVPIFFMIMFFSVIGNKSSGGQSLYPYLLLPSLTILTSLAPAIVEWKNSVFLKRIDTTGVKKGMFLGALWLFYLLVSLVALVVMFIVALIIGEIIKSPEGTKSFASTLSQINWGWLILATILVSLTSIGLATLFGGLFNSEGAMQGIVMMVYFFSIFFSGIMIDPSVVETSKGMMIFTYFIPHKYSVFLFLYATQGSINSGWDSSFNNHVAFGGKDFTATWQPILGATLIIAALFLITVFTFKWSAKK